MSNRQRPVLLLLLFAAASTLLLVLAVPPLSTTYTLKPSQAFPATSSDDRSEQSGDNDSSRENGEYRGSFPAAAYPLVARLEDRVALFSPERRSALDIGSYAVLGDLIVATGDGDDASDSSGDSYLLNSAGREITVSGAPRIWSRGRRVLALSDDGRRFADISADVFPERVDASREADNPDGAAADQDQIEPRWHYADAPLVAAASFGERTVAADALGHLYFLDSEGVRRRSEESVDGSMQNVLALAGDGSGSVLYAIAGVAPTTLYRIDVDNDERLRPAASSDLTTTLRTPPRIEAVEGMVAVAYENVVRLYNSELELVGRQILDGEVLRIGFFSEQRLLYVRSADPERADTEGAERLSVYYADDLSFMYRMDFDFPVYSMTASAGGFTVGSEHGVLLYEEVSE